MRSRAAGLSWFGSSRRHSTGTGSLGLGSVGIVSALTLCFSSVLPRSAEADQVPSASIVVRGKDQDALAVGIASGQVLAHVCPSDAASRKAPPVCEPTGQTGINPPSSVRSRLAGAQLRKVITSQGRELVEVSLAPSSAEPRRWVLLLAAGDGAPRVVWSGFASADEGSEYLVEKDGSGEKIAVTKRIAVCGKTVVASRAALDPKSLELVVRAGEDPLPDARKAATKVTAKKLSETPKVLRLLRSARASSGDGSRLVDGDPDTAWSEDVPGAGARELVSLSAPDSVSVLGFDLTFRAPQGVSGARAPKSLLLVTQDKSFAVELPEDPASGGASFSVELAEPIHTRCLAVVLGDAFPEKKSEGAKPKGEAADATTYVSELSLRTKWEGSTLDDLAGSLQGGGTDARARADVLGVAGDLGVSAAIGAYAKLDGPGQDLARRVIDAAGCAEKLPLYIPMLASRDEADSGRARDRVRRCGKDAAAQLLAKLDATVGNDRSIYAEELALLSPDTAVPALVRGLAAAKTPAERLLYRRALVKAADRDSSVRAFEAALAKEAFGPLSVDTKLDLLRAMGTRLGQTKGGTDAFTGLAAEATDFRARFLLLGPAAALARSGNQAATVALAKALGQDPDGRIRARAAEVAQGISSLDSLVIAAASDPAVRVREAAAHSLEGKKLDVPVQSKLAKALTAEPWTFVRRAVVQSLGGMKGDAAVDASLAFAMEHEDQPTVRRDILAALGARGATSQRQAIKDRADDTGEAVDVRVEALQALGAICDKTSIDDLTKIALKGATPFYEADRKLSTAAIAALGRLHPSDLASRLAPLQSDKVPGDVKDSARSAIAEKSVCR